MEMLKNLHLIVNPMAAQSDSVLARLNAVLEQYKLDWRVYMTQDAGDGIRFAHDAIDNGAEIIVVYGNDGTITEVANGIYLSDIPMAVLHSDTGNNTAGALAVPDDVELAIRQVIEGQGEVIWCDAARFQERILVLRLDVCASAYDVIEINQQEKTRYGVLPYLVNSLKNHTASEPITFRIKIDGRAIETAGIALMIANLNTLGLFNRQLGRRIEHVDGVLDLLIAKDSLGRVTSLSESLTNSAQFEMLFEHYCGKSFVIETDEPVPIMIDGETVTTTPIEIEVLPKAIRLFVPKPSHPL